MALSFFHFLLLGWLSWQAYRRFINSPVRLYYFPALGLKLFAGIASGLLYYLYYGGGDTINYHHDASELASLALNDLSAYIKVMAGGEAEQLSLIYSQEVRALLAAKIFSVFYLFTGSNYWVTACYVSFLSFLCLCLLVHRLVKGRPEMRKPAAIAFLVWPSFVFWTSGLLKESLAMVCIAFIVAAVLPYLQEGKKIPRLEAGVSVLLFILLWKLKYYYAALLGPVLVCLLVVLWMGRNFAMKQVWMWCTFILFLAGGILLATQLHPNLYLSRFLAVWVENYYLIVAASSDGGYVVYDQLEAGWGSVLQNAPEAIAAGLYAPLISADFTNPVKLIAIAENLLLLILSLIGITGWILEKKGNLSLPAFAVIIYVVAFALVIGIAAPNYGTLSRYRISYQPFFVLLILTGCQYFIRWLQGERGETS